MSIPSNYYNILASIESSNNPLAKAATSSASGLYQFTKSTAIALGLPWGTNSNAPFGGASVSVDQQNNAIATLTNQNANILSNNGIAVDNNSLYAAHFLGAGTAADVLKHSDTTPISSIVPQNVISSNTFLASMSVGDFKNWLNQKVSVGQGSSSTPSTATNPLAQATTDLGIGNPLGAVGDIAGSIVGGDIGAWIKGIFGGAAGKTAPGSASVENATGASTGSAKNILDWVKAFFSINTAERVTAVVIGVGLVIVAIIFLTNSEQIVVNTGKAALAA